MKKLIFISLFVVIADLGFTTENLKTRDDYWNATKRAVNGGDNKLADKTMAEMLEKFPTDPDALGYKGMLLIGEEKLNEAEEIFKKCIKYNPDYSDGYWYLGVIKSRQNIDDEAENYLKKAIELNPKSQAHGDLAEIYAYNEHYNEAEIEMGLYLQYRKLNWKDYQLLAYIHEKQGKYEQVIEDYRKARHLDPYNLIILLSLGESYERVGNYYEALKTYEFAWGWHSYDPRLKEALERARKLIKEHPPKEPILDYKGTQFLKGEQSTKYH